MSDTNDSPSVLNVLLAGLICWVLFVAFSFLGGALWGVVYLGTESAAGYYGGGALLPGIVTGLIYSLFITTHSLSNRKKIVFKRLFFHLILNSIIAVSLSTFLLRGGFVELNFERGIDTEPQAQSSRFDRDITDKLQTQSPRQNKEAALKTQVQPKISTKEYPVYTIYRSSPVDPRARIHIATINQEADEDIAHNYAVIIRDTFAGQIGVRVKYWIEKGNFKPKSNENIVSYDKSQSDSLDVYYSATEFDTKSIYLASFNSSDGARYNAGNAKIFCDLANKKYKEYFIALPATRKYK